MEEVNQFVVSKFFILELCDSWELQGFFLVIFSLLCLITVLGNTFTVVIIITEPHFKSPMYFLLENFSFIDFCLFSVTKPKMIRFSHGKQDHILWRACVSDFLQILLLRR